MPLININLLAQQQSKLSRMGQANFTVAVAAGVIIGLQLLIVVFLYSTIGIRNAEKKNAVNKTEEYNARIAEFDKQDETEFYKNMTIKQQAAAFQSQLDAARTLVDNHKYFSLYLSEIAINTPNTIYYSSMGSDSNNRLTITGRATNYTEVARLTESFKGLTFAKNAAIQDAKGGRTEAKNAGFPVTFTIMVDLKSAAELNKLPGPVPKPGQGGTPAPRPSAQPSASATGSPVPSGAIR